MKTAALNTFPATSTTATEQPVLNMGGGGVLFWWMAGVMQELCHKGPNNLTGHYSLRGASAGALACVFGACNINADDALDLAHKLALENGVFERPLGLVGVWGGIIRTWLHHLLPEDAAERCSGKVQIVVVAVPILKRKIISNFDNKIDVIDACLASTHVPFLMDGKFAAKIKGQRVIDGAFLDDLPRWVKLRWGPFEVLSGEADKVDSNKDIVHLSYHHDEELRKKG